MRTGCSERVDYIQRIGIGLNVTDRFGPSDRAGEPEQREQTRDCKVNQREIDLVVVFVLEEYVDDAESDRVQECHDTGEHKERGTRGDVRRLGGHYCTV